jgi:hypothetical protein
LDTNLNKKNKTGDILKKKKQIFIFSDINSGGEEDITYYKALRFSL